MRRITSLFIALVVLMGLTIGFQSAVTAQDDQATLDANKAVVRKYFEEALTQNKPELVDELFDPSYVFHAGSGDLPGTANTKSFITSIKTAVPDSVWTTRDLIADGPYVLIRVSVSGTQAAPFNGLPNTGGSIKDVPGMGMYKLANGKIVESWNEDNFLVIGQQLGTAPAPFGVPVFTDFGQPVGPQTDQATRDANKAVVQRLIDEAWSGGNMEVINELYDPAAVNHPTAAGQAPDVSGIGLQISIFRASMPDMKLNSDIMIAEGDEVATRVTITGTDTGGLFGFAPTNKQLTTGGIRTDRLKDGKIVETWFIIDTFKLFQDTGLIPPAATPVATPVATPTT
ncbi:MAG: ester cyclase [Thermomicrobiales bacterium]